MMLYPGSAPDFRILRSTDGSWRLQVRYINITQGYRSLWTDVPIVEETVDDVAVAESSCHPNRPVSQNEESAR